MGLILKCTLTKKTGEKEETEGKRVDGERSAKKLIDYLNKKHPGKYEKFELWDEHKFLKELK